MATSPRAGGRSRSSAQSVSERVAAVLRQTDAMARKPPKAYSYVRFSSADQAGGDSLRRQADAAERYATANGLVLDKSLTLRDLGVSAYSGANVRAGAALKTFLDAIESGRVPEGSFLLIEALDRLSRLTARKAIRILESIIEAGVIVVTLKDGKRYTRESLDGLDLIAAMLEMVGANQYSAGISGRVKASWDGRRKQYGPDAIVPGQKAPFWVRVHPKTRLPSVDPKYGRIAARIAREYLSGRPIRETVRDLNTDRIPSPQGAAWSRITVSRTLRSLVKRPKVSPLSAAETARLKAAMTRRRWEGRARTDGDTSVLRGLGRCGYCGQPLAFATKPHRTKTGAAQTYHYLRCNTNAEFPGRCDGPAHIRYEPVAQAVIELALRVADHPPSVSPKTAREYEKAQAASEAALDKAERIGRALEKNPSAKGAKMLREAWGRYKELEAVADAALAKARPGYDAFDAGAIRRATSDTELNRVLWSFLDHVSLRHERKRGGAGKGSITFHYQGGGEATLRYEAAPRPRSGRG